MQVRLYVPPVAEGLPAAEAQIRLLAMLQVRLICHSISRDSNTNRKGPRVIFDGFDYDEGSPLVLPQLLEM